MSQAIAEGDGISVLVEVGDGSRRAESGHEEELAAGRIGGLRTRRVGLHGPVRVVLGPSEVRPRRIDLTGE